mmetsp:Transcript_25806/g.92038  ORF Transcript_25806/g.92038 Transcript_25806/m.92038 type:complete len:226 (-) Transcript_25806:277-954(-)
MFQSAPARGLHRGAQLDESPRGRRLVGPRRRARREGGSAPEARPSCRCVWVHRPRLRWPCAAPRTRSGPVRWDASPDASRRSKMLRSPMRSRKSRSTGRPTAASIRRTWRFWPSSISTRSHCVGRRRRRRMCEHGGSFSPTAEGGSSEASKLSKMGASRASTARAGRNGATPACVSVATAPGPSTPSTWTRYALRVCRVRTASMKAPSLESRSRPSESASRRPTA